MALNKQTFINSVCSTILTVIFLGAPLKPVKSQWVIDDEGCRTPDRGVGTCISVKECRPMIEFIQQATAAKLSSNVVETLQKYQCGFEGNNPKVCCPGGPISINGSHTPPTILTPPDVTNHLNLRLLPYNCGVHIKDRIIGGNRTGLFEYPWMALLAYRTGTTNSFRCGGTIISERYILTAAHCVSELGKFQLVSVRLGEHNIDTDIDCEKNEFGDEICADPVQDIDVEQSIPHPNYNRSDLTNDVALVRLVANINTTSDRAKPICLPITNQLRNFQLNDMKLTVTGWGATETGRKSSVLLYVNVPVTTEDVCRKAYEKSPAKINYRQICAGGERGKDSCAGDSGGPLQNFTFHNEDVRFIQYGVVSFGPRFCGQEAIPGVYTKVAYYMDWILDTMRP